MGSGWSCSAFAGPRLLDDPARLLVLSHEFASVGRRRRRLAVVGAAQGHAGMTRRQVYAASRIHRRRATA